MTMELEQPVSLYKLCTKDDYYSTSYCREPIVGENKQFFMHDLETCSVTTPTCGF